MDSCSSAGMIVSLPGCMLVVLGWLAWSAPAVQSMAVVENRTNLSFQEEAISIRAQQQEILFGCWIIHGRSIVASARARGDCRNESSSASYVSPAEGSTAQTSIFMQNLPASWRASFDALRSIFTTFGCNLAMLINNPQRILSYGDVGSSKILPFSSPSAGTIHPPHHTSLAAKPSHAGLHTPAASIARKLLAPSVDQTKDSTDSLTLGPPDPPQPRDLPALKKASSALHPPDAYHSSLPP